MNTLIKDTEYWNKQFKLLKTIIYNRQKISEVKLLIIELHGLVHTQIVSTLGIQTIEDRLWSKINNKNFRIVPKKKEFSAAIHLWHSARIEDLVCSFLIKGTEQILTKNGFNKSLSVTAIDTGNSFLKEEAIEFSSTIDLHALQEYRTAVGKQTQDVIQQFTNKQLKSKVSSKNINMIKAANAVSESSEWLLEYWGKKTIGGLVLMPLTRHLLVHINQAERLLGKSP